MNRSFNDVQLFFEFLTVLNDPEKRKTIDGAVVDLLSNLDSSGKTNAAIELAKIYSWYTKMVDYDGTNFKIKADVIPAEVNTTYDFREGTEDGTFEYLESGGTDWQSIKIHNAATLDEHGKVPASQLPSYVDDVIECYYDADVGKIYSDAEKTIEITPERGIIYIDVPTSKCYRWSGTQFVVTPGDIPDFVGATASNAGVHGLVPAPESGKNESYLRGDATWGDPVEDFRTKINANTDVLVLNCNNKPELLT